MKKRWLVIPILLFITAVPLGAQDIEDNVSRYTSVNGKLYLQPLADTFGANLNSGLFRSARIPRMGFHLYFGVHMMAAAVSDDQKTFIAVPEENFNPPPGTELPTVFGSEEGVEVEGIDEPVPGAWSTDWVPLAVPQITVGSIMGTDFTLRYIKLNVDEDIGDLSLNGYGFRHSLSQYIPLMPLDLALGYFRQNFRIGDLVEANATLFSIQASYKFSVLVFYGGLGFETSSLDIRYTYEENDGESTEIFFELDGKNKTRGTLGLVLDLPVLKLYGEYNPGSQTTYSAGLGFGF